MCVQDFSKEMGNKGEKERKKGGKDKQKKKKRKTEEGRERVQKKKGCQGPRCVPLEGCEFAWVRGARRLLQYSLG
jgi:ribosomal protein S8E